MLIESKASLPALGVPFAAAGYDTGHIGKWHMDYLSEDVSTHGFRRVANRRNNGADPNNAAAAFAFLDRERDADKPFFLCVSYNNPHNICEWARGERGALPDGTLPDPPPPEELPPPKANAEPPEDEPEIAAFLRRSYQAFRAFPVGDFTEKDWREYRWGYYRMAEQVDQYIGELLAGLEARSLRDNTMVVFLSDHGDAQGAHRWNQKTVFFEESARVPLIVRWPGRVPAGRASERLVNIGTDLMPTLLEAAGIDSPGDLPGASFLPVAAGDASAPDAPEYLVCQARFAQGAAIEGENPEVESRMLRTDGYKYMVFDRGDYREMLFDLQNDPGETSNLARNESFADILKQHRRLFRDFARHHGDSFPGVDVNA